ncbi:MAG: zinc ABC transporter substrate-binding protein [Candidatus Bathyarchaeota archaeon]|nr:zinc ABC transporter substrate-binding protein [Candidatus Bathyarchaeota archaeon]
MKSKKLLPFCIALIMLSLPLLSVLVIEAQPADKPIIVCTTSAIGNIVEECLGDNADVLVLVQPGLCPADFDMKPGYVDAVSKAQILFKQNIQGEFWLDGLLTAAGNPDLKVVAIPGIYNTPAGAKNYILGVGGNLSQILNVDLDSKISEMLNDVDEVTSLMASQAATIGASNVKVICMGWLKPFIDSAGFTVVATFNPPETLSVGDIASLLEIAEQEEVALVVDNLQIDTEFGAGIAYQVGAEHLVLTNFPGAIPNTETLVKMLRYNAEQLFNATITWQYASTLRAERVNLHNQVTLLQIATMLAVVVALVEAVLLYAKRKKKL